MVQIRITNLVKNYTNKGKDKPAVDNISLSDNLHGIFTIIGRNGAGKTTLIKMLSTALLPTAGSIIIDGIDVVKYPDKIRERIAVVPQEARLIPWMTVFQNILVYLLWRGFGYREASERAMHAIKEFGLSSYANLLPDKLSGGTKRKALVALVMASEADILFLDEPTTGLDPISRRELWNILEKVKKDKLIILTTHYLEEAERLSDKILILDKGKIVSYGTIEQLRSKVGYPFALRIFGQVKGVKLKGLSVKKENSMQVFLSKKEAYNLASKLIRKGIKFSVSPTSLEDIFYMLVGDINKDYDAYEEKNY